MIAYILSILIAEGLCGLYCYANSYGKEDFKDRFGLLGGFVLMCFVFPWIISWASKIH